MKQLSIITPKPLIKVLGKPILEYNLDMALSRNFKRIFINVYYLASQIEKFINDYIKRKSPKAEIIVVREEKLLENGGTVKSLSKDLSDRTFVLNGDVIFKANIDVFQYMENRMSDEVDFLLLVQSVNQATNYTGTGDFNINEKNEIIFTSSKQRSHIYTGLQILRPKIVSQHAADVFKLSNFFSNNYNIQALQIQGLNWYHLSEPKDIITTEEALTYNNVL